MLLTCTLLAFLLCPSSPEAEGVSSRKVLQWLDACDRDIDYLHGFVFLRHGKLIAEGTWAPCDTLNQPHLLSSHSKCFITTAIGFLVEDGKLDLDEPVIDILADKAPAKPSRNLVRLRVRDLLTMTLGSTRNEGWKNDRDGDWVKAILANEIDRTPGTAYKYDSGATHLLGAIIERKSGQPLMKFLKNRLFDRIGIEKAWTTYDPTGQACAAWGLHMTTREISLIGQLYLDKGVWNGTRLLSSDWVDLATTKQTHSGKDFNDRDKNGRNDWLLGFGLNFWRCQHGCYRADGWGGQYTIVFPEHDAVLSINADVVNMQHILDVVWEHFIPVFSPAALPEDREAAAALRMRCANLSLPPVAGKPDGGDAFLGRDYEFKSGPGSVKSVRLDKAAKGWTLQIKTGSGEYKVPVGFGGWECSTMRFSARNHEPLGEIVGDQRIATSAAVQDDGSIRLRMHLIDGIHRMDLHFCKRLFRPTVEGGMFCIGEFKVAGW